MIVMYCRFGIQPKLNLKIAWIFFYPITIADTHKTILRLIRRPQHFHRTAIFRLFFLWCSRAHWSANQHHTTVAILPHCCTIARHAAKRCLHLCALAAAMSMLIPVWEKLYCWNCRKKKESELHTPEAAHHHCSALADGAKYSSCNIATHYWNHGCSQLMPSNISFPIVSGISLWVHLKGDSGILWVYFQELIQDFF